ncbi:MAG: tetratricopeptide repeat protein [Spirochaetota bacterium]|jgi:tetratricopeptide (TPR) repeat protein|nr:tetratricopeptide repeat protein [Spirochaetota bacterium]
MNDRARVLIGRFVLCTFFLGALAAGLVWLLLPVLHGAFGAEIFSSASGVLRLPDGSPKQEMEFFTVLPALLGIGLAAAAAFAFSQYGHGAQQDPDDYSFLGPAFAWIIFFALGISAYTSFVLPGIQLNLVYAQNRADAPEQPGETERGGVRTFREGARLYYDARYDAALEKFREFLELYPHNGIAEWYRGRAAAELTNQQKLRAVPEINEQTALFQRGYDHLLSGDYVQAIIEFERVLQINPEHAPAKQHLELAQRKIQDMQEKSPGELADAGLKARLVAHANEGMELHKDGDARGCLKNMEEILLLEPHDPTALRYSEIARAEIAQHDFLDEEISAIPFLPACRNILVPTANGGHLYAKYASFTHEHLYLRDFWIIQPRDYDGGMRALGGDLGKLMPTNTLIIRGARIMHTEDQERKLRHEAKYTGTLLIDPALAQNTALVYSEGISLSPVSMLQSYGALESLGWPVDVLWRNFNRQLGMPSMVFLMASLAAALGWRYRKQHLLEGNFFQTLIAMILLCILTVFTYTALIRLLDGLTALFDKWNIAGWVLAPVWFALTIFTAFILLGRVMRPRDG